MRPTKFPVLIAALCMLSFPGCSKKTVLQPGGSSEQRQLAEAFLLAHDQADLEGLKALVDWDGVSDAYRDHFTTHMLQAKISHKILSIGIVDISMPPSAFQHYNIQPEKFLAVHYDDDPPERGNLYPIAQKDGRYVLVLQTGI